MAVGVGKKDGEELQVPFFGLLHSHPPKTPEIWSMSTGFHQSQLGNRYIKKKELTFIDHLLCPKQLCYICVLNPTTSFRPTLKRNEVIA